MNGKFSRKSYLVLVAVLAMAMMVVGVFAQDDQASLSFVGKIEAMTKNSIVVNGREFFLDNADINTDLAIGAQVMVDGTLDANGHNEARDVRAADDRFILPGELRITGVLNESSDNSFDLGGKFIDRSDAQTDTSLNAGSVIRVFATPDGFGDWSARRVMLFDRTNADVQASTDFNTDLSLFNDNRYELVGTLDSVNSDNIVISGMMIDATDANIHSDLALGALVSVWLRDDDNRFHAVDVSNANIQTDLNTDAFVNLDLQSNDSSDSNTSVDANANANVDTSVGANTNSNSNNGSDSNTSVDANANANVDTSVGVDTNSSSNNGSDSNTSVDANANVDANVGANTSSNSNSNDGSSNTSTSTGLNINLGAGLHLQLGGH